MYTPTRAYFVSKNGIAQVARREIKLLPESGMHVRDVMLAILAQILAIGIDHRGSVEVQARHLLFVDRNHDHHAVLGGDLLHQLGGRAIGHALGQVVPANVLLGAEIRTVEKFLQAEYLHFLLRGLLDQLQVLVDHGLLDFRQRAVIGSSALLA